MPVRGVLFDLDDTLFDHEHATVQALLSLRAEDSAFGLWTEAEFAERHSVVLEAMHLEVLAGRVSIESAREERFRRLLVDAGHKEASTHAMGIARRYRAVYETAWRPIQGAPDLLTAVRAAGLPIAIVTNNLVAEQELKLRRCGLDTLVDALVTSEETGAAKPDARMFNVALDRLGIGASEAVMVGDAWGTDIEGALAAGIRPIWFNWRRAASPNQEVAEVRSLEPTASVLALITSDPRTYL